MRMGFLLVILISINSAATLLKPLTLEEQLQYADVVAYAVVKDVSANAKGELIAELFVRELVKGIPEKRTLKLRLFRGATEELGHVVGAPLLKQNDEGLFFLKKSEGDLFRIVGLSQGSLKVRRDHLGLRWVGEQNLNSVLSALRTQLLKQ